MFAAVLVALAVLGGATWSVQNGLTVRYRRLGNRVTGVLLGASLAILATAVVWAVVTSP